MAPSRGFIQFRLLVRHHQARNRCHIGSRSSQRHQSSLAERLAAPISNVQSYVSRSKDPFLNLAIEDFILRTSHPDSTILFLYANRPSIVIGRNQNPWSEVNLSSLHPKVGRTVTAERPHESATHHVDLVRRRSGGGAVFHDEGNLNWSIVCPRDVFTRDKHAEMVVRALRRLGVTRARVNERHDVVLDQGARTSDPDPSDTHLTPYTASDGVKPLKVSGSAYKLTRARALHHATTLLASPNLHVIPQYLHSPGRMSIQAKGVESVSSPVGNIGLEPTDFRDGLLEEFAQMYEAGSATTADYLDDDCLDIPYVRKGYEELRTEDWMWSQTPEFTVTLRLHISAAIKLTVRHGAITAVGGSDPAIDVAMLEELTQALVGQKLHEIKSWPELLRQTSGRWEQEGTGMIDQLEVILPVPLSFHE